MGKAQRVGLPAPEAGETAFETAYPLLRAGLRRCLARMGARRARGFGMSREEYREVTEEVADETLCVARLRLGEYDPARGPLSWWLVLLGRDVLKRELRNWVRTRLGQSRAAEVLPTSAPEPGIRRVLQRDRLGRALRALPADQARALALTYLFEHPVEEVGRLMGRTTEAVSSLLQRARANAREALEGRPVRRRGRPRKEGEA